MKAKEKTGAKSGRPLRKKAAGQELMAWCPSGDVHDFVLGVSRREEEVGRRLWRDGGSLQASSS